MKRIAVYGKGGIGKSTISSNLTAALSEMGKKVMQIGCDPKHDSTRLLTKGRDQQTVLAYLRDTNEDERKLDDIAERGYKGCICVEAGGPEPGIGCAGRGIISAFDLLEELGMNDVDLDIVLYDVLGDVVCGGFAVPLRNNYADLVYIVTSGEFMSIYAANNILRGTANYNPERIGGIIFNSRGDSEEKERVKKFADAVGIPIIAEFERSKMFLEAEQNGKTVTESFPDSEMTKKFFRLADKVIEGKRYTAKYLSESELETVVLGRSVVKKSAQEREPAKKERTAVKKCVPRSTGRKEVVHGCAFAGTLCITLSVEGLATVLHAPRDCAHYAVQMVTNALRRSFTNENIPIRPFARPNVKCSDMDDADMIFGCISSLESDVREMIEKGNDVIAVVTSCPSGIIGEDVDGMMSRIRSEHPDVTIVPIIEDGNIKGDYMQGATDACIQLIRSLAVKGKKERSVNLIGMKTFGINTTENVRFVTEVLERLGVRMNCTCVGDTSVEKIKNIPNSELCILMTPDTIAVETMNVLEKEFGMKATKNMARPGLKETELWIREIAEHFGEEEKAERVITDIRKEFSDRLGPFRKDLKGKKLYIVGMKRDINWLLEAAVGCEMNVVRCVVMDILDRSEAGDLELAYDIEMTPGGKADHMKYVKDRTERILDPYIPVDPGMFVRIKEDVAAISPDIFLSTYPVNTETRTCFLPVNPDVTPFAGIDLAASLMRTLKVPKKEGWKKDVV
ncbi:MAG: AAA family ATPase [Methanomassiliicoccaceae archaeon]|nr:AAA family ATPase [Methanomassiliicoccaceae archaeon]